jgi:hypothetical protein
VRGRALAAVAGIGNAAALFFVCPPPLVALVISGPVMVEAFPLVA